MGAVCRPHRAKGVSVACPTRTRVRFWGRLFGSQDRVDTRGAAKRITDASAVTASVVGAWCLCVSTSEDVR